MKIVRRNAMPIGWRSFSSPEPRIDPRLWETMEENMRRRILIAKNWLFEPYGACSLLVLTWMHQSETLLIVLHENQWEDPLFQDSPEPFSPSVKRRALGSRLGWRWAFKGVVSRFCACPCFGASSCKFYGFLLNQMRFIYHWEYYSKSGAHE